MGRTTIRSHTSADGSVSVHIRNGSSYDVITYEPEFKCRILSQAEHEALYKEHAKQQKEYFDSL